ncbi:MAG: L-threonylcarbamoyladenylate synthase [Syntrophotalea acetylenica]|jgi:tRNA threonylcarbamoyl adenosine modification protein (Sua5/YciO/YrdC/YwlC family)|uniref:Threonylcarbamoyl-AMP synthase n=1 Tax=Syntrophotalea acetylenica TaxID=29542 RepID=A0A1L3GIX6_SYNAC|nr:L-threonylcarbamoyladenylate synthase [Syntrophotalea acetylenica]APG25882.1 threonylcarbamoyl-AMP synthase [Syntrophotalea acetylenica]APG43953.1 threonylcarbamoyl-AMP synthase [Syntrophotalea acetylenica]MDD4457784.1 L-threonylcarbamoyladenylate synthase [Syntrophotalea acetylenica]MDY0262728.1 L-threonylcarbamoyladenylate synthase [Syntrophotalea acetylenica]
MILAINPDTPQKRLINRVVECVKQGGVIAYPTDTIYGLGCDIFNRKGVKRIYQMKERSQRKPFSFICADLSDVANYAQVSNFAFKIMRRYLPGPYTFVLEATRVVPDLLVTKQKTVGIRIPSNSIALAIVRELGHPLVTTSANISGEEPCYDPSVINERLGRQIDMIVDGGIITGEASTVISLIDDKIEVLRQGAGNTDWIHQL